MQPHASHDYAALLLRVSLGLLMLAHGFYLKLFVFGAAGTVGFFESLGLPALVAWLVIAGETLGGLGLIFGVLTRWAAVLLIPIALGATWAHAGFGWAFSNPGGGWEFPLFLSVTLAVQALLGDGAYALGPRLKALFARSPQPVAA
jgi:putative oxidoreductase